MLSMLSMPSGALRLCKQIPQLRRMHNHQCQCPSIHSHPLPLCLVVDHPPPKHCSPQLQQSGSKEDPDNYGSNVTVAAIYYGKTRLNVNDVELAAVGSIYRSDHINDDNNSGDEEWTRRQWVPGGKMMGEMKDDQPEENNDEDDDEGTIMRLDVKSKSKMSDADLSKYFNSELQKEGASECGNCNCLSLTILRDGQVHSAIARYLSWFW